MKDEEFIERILKKGAEAREKVMESFNGLSSEQFNWKPSPKSWSMAQCLEHLVISDSVYFTTLQKIAEGKFKMTFWEKYSPFTKLFGLALRGQLEETGKRKMQTAMMLVPSYSDKSLDFIETYFSNLNKFLNHISNCTNADLDKTIITSPIASFVTYSLRDAFQFLSQHEHRHINQAIRVKAEPGFPKK